MKQLPVSNENGSIFQCWWWFLWLNMKTKLRIMMTKMRNRCWTFVQVGQGKGAFIDLKQWVQFRPWIKNKSTNITISSLIEYFDDVDHVFRQHVGDDGLLHSEHLADHNVPACNRKPENMKIKCYPQVLINTKLKKWRSNVVIKLHWMSLQRITNIHK